MAGANTDLLLTMLEGRLKFVHVHGKRRVFLATYSETRTSWKNIASEVMASCDKRYCELSSTHLVESRPIMVPRWRSSVGGSLALVILNSPIKSMEKVYNSINGMY